MERVDPGRRTASGIDRRAFLASGVGLIGGFIVAVIGIPVVGYVASPALKRRAESAWTKVGFTSDFKANEPTRVEFNINKQDGWVERTEKKAVWIVAKEDGELVAFNNKCTHLGCAFDWKPDKKEFICPCHTAVFSLEGKVLGGPPPRPLDSLPVQVEGDEVSIQYKEFKLGVPGKSEL